MPPHKGPGRGIVKSGNAGNSTKSPAISTSGDPNRDKEKEKPLFPPGSKFPLSLLNERCQKNGWEKPEVNTRHHPNGHSFVVTLRRQNKKTSQVDSVRLEPHPPFLMPTALEARHWGATYALYRVCNNIQLNRVLPPGPREYWSRLEQEHKAAPEHMKWMYNTDPFAARKEVETRQENAAKRREEGGKGTEPGSTSKSGAVGSDFIGAIEVKMSGPLRDLVENAVKHVHENRSHPGDGSSMPPSLPLEIQPSLTESLKHLSFTAAQISRTLKALGTPSPLTTSLLYSSTSPLEAAISHLLLCVPESDLPPRFLARGNSEAFVQSTHKGTEDLRIRWLLERAVKEAGYPEPIVRRHISPVTSPPPSITDPPSITWEMLIYELGRKLIGEDSTSGPLEDDDIEERDLLRASEIAALESVYPSVADVTGEASKAFENYTAEATTYLHIPITATPLILHMILPRWHPYPLLNDPPPMYVSADNISTTAPKIAPYLRLHILSTILSSPIVKHRAPGEGIGLVAAGIIEDEWERIQSQGPPDVANVLKHLVEHQSSVDSGVAPTVPNDAHDSGPKMSAKRGNIGRTVDSRRENQILQDFAQMQTGRQFLSLLEGRKNLPAWTARKDLIRAFSSNRVVVCVGETGSGKTTQVPQFIYDEYLAAAAGKSNFVGLHVPSLAHVQIVVTQPRRVAATSVAARVSAERGEDGSVGYSIRGESNATRRTKILFCTTGVVLRRLGAGQNLRDVDVIIVDEVHERSVDSDFLLLELRELLKTNERLRVILMSATINQQKFLDYFGGAALVSIPGRTFPVDDLYLEDVVSRIRYTPAFSKPAQKQNEEELRSFRQRYKAQGLDVESIRALEIITRAGRIDYQLVGATVAHIAHGSEPGAILIFMPGVQEIKECMDAIRSELHSAVEVLPLHANLSGEEQKRAFRTTAKRKVVVATNVAETSITIDDVAFVIDAGKVKETSYDPDTGLSRLTETWITQAAARQRKGRAGRTRPGTCFKLYTRQQMEEMGSFPVPEMLRVPLESLSLAVKAMRVGEDVALFLGKAIDPPKVTAMERAWSVLQELGAVDSDESLTALGRYMSLLPIDLRLGKMLVLASIFECQDSILTVVACLSAKPLFFSPMEKREEATRARARFMSENSDLLTDVNAYDECMRVLSTQGSQMLRDFCDKNFISYPTVREITSLRSDLSSALSSAGFSLPSHTSTTHPALLKSIIAAGLYPRLARITLPQSAIKFDKVQAGTVQRAQGAREYKLFDLEREDSGGRGERVFVHPGSVLFNEARWKEPFVCYFRKAVTTKPFLRDVTEVPMYAVLLFGGPITVDHIGGGLTVRAPGGAARMRLKAWPRIGVLVNQLRRLLDSQLADALESTRSPGLGKDSPVREAMLALLTKDELSA